MFTNVKTEQKIKYITKSHLWLVLCGFQEREKTARVMLLLVNGHVCVLFHMRFDALCVHFVDDRHDSIDAGDF